MNTLVQQVYCDESGTTGNNLMHPEQPIFSYASVAITAEEARACVEKVVRDYRVQAGELKSKNLLKYNKGRRAISFIFDAYHEQILVSVFHKKYNLACKFFEYAFEPTIAEVNSIFYGVGFHKFIANVLYVHFRARARYAEEIFEEFEKLMRELNDTSITHLFSSLHMPHMDPILDLIKRFCFLNRQTILGELEALRGHGAGKWLLDLTDTALFTHLGAWGAKYHQLDVYCDKTKALEGFLDIFKVMIGREERIYNAFLDREQPITFNLLREISMVDSCDCPGVQLADVAAGAAVYALQNRDDPQAREWIKYFPKMLHRLSVLPDLDQVDLEEFPAQRNLILLQELVQRSERGLSLIQGIGEFLAETTRYLIGRRAPLIT